MFPAESQDSDDNVLSDEDHMKKEKPDRTYQTGKKPGWVVKRTFSLPPVLPRDSQFQYTEQDTKGDDDVSTQKS